MLFQEIHDFPLNFFIGIDVGADPALEDRLRAIVCKDGGDNFRRRLVVGTVTGERTERVFIESAPRHFGQSPRLGRRRTRRLDLAGGLLTLLRAAMLVLLAAAARTGIVSGGTFSGHLRVNQEKEVISLLLYRPSPSRYSAVRYA